MTRFIKTFYRPKNRPVLRPYWRSNIRHSTRGYASRSNPQGNVKYLDQEVGARDARRLVSRSCSRNWVLVAITLLKSKVPHLNPGPFSSKGHLHHHDGRLLARWSHMMGHDSLHHGHLIATGHPPTQTLPPTSSYLQDSSPLKQLTIIKT